MATSGDCWSEKKPGIKMNVVPSVATVDVELGQPFKPPLSSDVGSDGICFHDICYEVTQRKCCCIKQANKKILNGVSGLMPPGLNAIMGPTGSGKTTLLDILAARRNISHLTGTILVNGERQPENFKCISGYVVQDDVVMGTLSVKENLYFSAALRLPSSVSWAEKKQRVEKVIDQLGLSNCAHTKIGNEFIRGVSGGERKRTNIGMELIIEPQFLFLDEPTTGLDAYTAVSVVKLLKSLSHENNRTVIMSIHQPRYSIYKQFDTLTLLSLGNLVFHGPTHPVLEHFAEIGHVCEEHDNPADFLLDIINECENSQGSGAPGAVPAIEDGLTDLSAVYRRSELGRSMMDKCRVLADGAEHTKLNQLRSKIFSRTRYPMNFLWQLLIVSIRSSVNLFRYPMTSFLQFIIIIIFATIIGAIYFNLDTGPNGYQDRIGAFFFIVMNQVFGNLSAIDLFIIQKALFLHENASGYYRISSFFFSNILTDVIPLRFLPLVFFTIITYFMIGLQTAADRFFIYLLTLFLTTVGSTAIAFFISAGVRVAGIANLLVALSFVVQMLFGGFFIALESLPVWIRWMQYLSLFRYSIEALAVNEIDGLVFSQSVNGTTILVDGVDILEVQGFNPSWLWYDQIGLLVISLIFLALTYITLRFAKKEK